MFVTFEGGEGAGKTTQIAHLASRLQASASVDVLMTREPGAGPLGAELRRLVLAPPQGVLVDPRAELLLLVADRAQHVAQIIRPHLASGGHVLCDRYTDSSLAYQGYGRGLALGEIEHLNAYATDGLTPDLTVLLDVDPAVGLLRQTERTRMEAETLSFHRRVRAGFLALAARAPARFHVVDASAAPDVVSAQIWARVTPLLPPARL
jgi:dTMP kinase